MKESHHTHVKESRHSHPRLQALLQPQPCKAAGTLTLNSHLADILHDSTTYLGRDLRGLPHGGTAIDL